MGKGYAVTKNVAEDARETEGFRMELDEVLRHGAQRMLQAIVDEEVREFVDRHQDQRDDNGRRFVVRNGHLPSRKIQTGQGPVEVKQPRVRDRRGAGSEEAVRFTSQVLPPYLRKTKNLEELLPWLYLKGISTGGFQDALSALVGPDAPGFSASTITRLTASWIDEHKEWCRRSLEGQEFVYIWADGIHFNVRLDGSRQCILVLMGATRDGKKELLAVQDGYRESEQSWSEILLDLKHRGLELPPTLAVGDGALGFWAALRKGFPETREQRCWVHKTANILNKLPKSLQPKAKSDLHEIYQAETRADAERAFDHFIEKYGAKYPAAVACLEKDREALLSFYDFPAEHWMHLRTTNPIESTFATVRLRHRRTKGSGSRSACLAMVFKLAESASKKWRRPNGYQRITQMLEGHRFKDGIIQEKDAA